MVSGVLKNPESRLFKKVEMRGAREIAAEAYLLIRWSEVIERKRSRRAFFNSLLGARASLKYAPREFLTEKLKCKIFGQSRTLLPDLNH